MDLGYKGTSRIIVAAAQSLPECDSVGVLTPSLAFQDTGVLNRLAERGIEFSVSVTSTS